MPSDGSNHALAPQASSPGPVSVLPARAASCDLGVLQMLVDASNGREIPHQTYLPEGMDLDAARAWAAARGPLAWAIFSGSAPVGWIEFEPFPGLPGLDLGTDVLEREVWLLPAARGRRLVRDAMDLPLDSLRPYASAVLALTWAHNTSAISALRNSGFQPLGSFWWGQSPAQFCEVSDEPHELCSTSPDPRLWCHVSRLEIEASGTGGPCEAWILYL